LNRGPPFASRKDIFSEHAFLTHSEFHHYPPRRLILDAALRKDPMQAEGVKRKLQQRLSDFGREALTRVT
jgi:hypothetical protein